MNCRTTKQTRSRVLLLHHALHEEVWDPESQEEITGTLLLLFGRKGKDKEQLVEPLDLTLRPHSFLHLPT